MLIEYCWTGLSASWYRYCDQTAISTLPNILFDFTKSELGPSTHQQNCCAARMYARLILLLYTLIVTILQQQMASTMQVTRLLMQMNGASSFTCLERNFTISTKSETKSYGIQKPKQERMQAFLHYPSIFVSTLQMSSRSHLSIFPDWQRCLLETNHGILKDRFEICCTSIFPSLLALSLLLLAPIPIWRTRMGWRWLEK